MATNHTQRQEIERLGKLAQEAHKNAQVYTSKPFPLHIDTREARFKTYYQPTQPILTKSAMEDVIMTDANPAEFERDIPMINDGTGDVESFIDRLKKYFGRHQKYYQTEPTTILYFIEDHLQGTAKKQYQMDEVFKPGDDPQPQRLMDKLLQEFKSERALEEVKTTMLKLRHEWRKAYEYLSEFNPLSSILQLIDETKKIVIGTASKTFGSGSLLWLSCRKTNARSLRNMLKKV